MLGATTLDEYRKFIEKDPALDRRFRPVMVEEPDKEATLAILNGIKPGLERHHHIRITDEAIQAALALSVRYLPDLYLPDKAIDLLDEGAAHVRMEDISTANTHQRQELEEELQEAVRESRFEYVGCIDGALCCAGAYNGMHFVHKEDHIPGATNLCQHIPEPLLEFAPVFGAGHKTCHIQAVKSFIL